jgi:multidrug resistance efflux pump
MNIWVLSLLLLIFAADDPPNIADSEEFIVREDLFSKNLIMSGELKAVERFTVTVPRISSTSSVVVTYLVPEGSMVERGDVLVRFDTSELEASRLDLEKRREDARIKIAQKEAELETREQDLLLNRATAEKNLKVAGLYREISPELIPRADVEQYQFDFERSTTELEKADERLKTLEKSRIAELEVVKLEFLEADLRLKRLEAEFEKLLIRAPIPGLVVYGDNPSRAGKIQVGDQLFSGWPVLHLPNMEKLKVEAYAYDSDFPALSGGEDAEVILDAFPSRSFNGRVTHLSEIAKSRQFRSQLKAFTVDVVLSDIDLDLMKPGMTARIRIPVSRKRGLIVPRKAIRLDGRGNASILRAGDASDWVPVQVLDANETLALVEGDLKAGDLISEIDLLEEGTSSKGETEWIPVTREDLRFHISGNGTLEAEKSVMIGPPPVRNTWQFKIVYLAPEGKSVMKGEPIVSFDPSEVQKNLREEQANLEKVKEELEKTAANEELRIKDLETQIEEALVQQEKAHNKLVQAREFESNLKVKEAEFEAELADLRVQLLQKKLKSVKRNSELQLKILEDRKGLHQSRIKLFQEAVESLNVRAPIDGVIIYETNWRNEKKQIGSQVFRMEKVMSLPDLNSLLLQGQVSEVDAGKIQLGQRVEVNLDALPEQTLYGTITKVGQIFREAAPNRPVKLLSFEVRLDQVDARILRPGMVAKAKIIYESYSDVIAIPLSIIEVDDTKSFIWVRAAEGPERREIKVGQNNGVVAIIESGLREGEEVSNRPLEAESQ